MFRFRRNVTDNLEFLVGQACSQGVEINRIKQKLRIIMGNQEVLDAYAAQISEQNNQVKAAVAVIISEIGKLQKAAEVPLDTAKIDAAISQLTAAVDEVEAIPTPAVTEEAAPVEEEAPVEEATSSEVVETETTLSPTEWQQ